MYSASIVTANFVQEQFHHQYLLDIKYVVLDTYFYSIFLQHRINYFVLIVFFVSLLFINYNSSVSTVTSHRLHDKGLIPNRSANFPLCIMSVTWWNINVWSTNPLTTWNTMQLSIRKIGPMTLNITHS
jgi:hypothetical protein